MKKSKKGAFVALVLVVCSFALFANGTKEGAQEKITLVYNNCFDPAVSPDGVHHMEKNAEYGQLNPNIEVQANILEYDQLKQQFIISGQASQGPDIIHMLGEWVPEMVSMGLIDDITDEMRDWEDFDKFPESCWKVATIGDRIYGIPSCASTRVLLYREDLLKEAGLEVPKTWEDLRKAAKALTKDTDGDGVVDIYGFAFCTSSKCVRGPQEFATFLNSVDKAELAVQENGKWIPGFTVEQAKKVFQFYYDLMFVDKCVPPYSIGWEWDELDPNFASGTIAMCQNGSWMKQRQADGVEPESWKTAAFPYCTTPATYLEVKVEGIGKFTKHRAEAIDFCKWLQSRDNMVYITTTDNLPSRSDAVDSPLWEKDAVWRDMFVENAEFGFSFPSIVLAPIFEKSMACAQEVLYEKATPAEAAQSFYDFTKNYLDTEVNI